MAGPRPNREIREIREAAREGHLSWAYERAVHLADRSPSDPVVLGLVGERNFDLQKYDEAAAWFERAIRHDRDRAVHLENLAFANRCRWRLDEAEKAIWAAIRLAPESPNCQAVLAGIRRARGDAEGAFEARARAAESEDPLTAAINLIAMARIRRAGGRPEEALRLVRRAGEHRDLWEKETAMAEDLEEYLRESPRLLALEDGMDLMEALFSRPGYGPSLRAALAEKCVEAGGAPAFVLGSLTMALCRLERYPEARAVADRVPPGDRSAGHRHVFTYAGEAAARMGDLADARDLLARATEVSPMETGPYVGLGTLLMERGLYEEAEPVLRRGLGFEEEGFGEVFFNLAQTLRCLRRYEEAVEFYERALEMDPEYDLVREPLEDVRRVISERAESR